jgi:hypothetical protein
MNQASKLIIASIAAFSLNAMMSKVFGKSSTPATPTPSQGTNPAAPNAKVANTSLLLKRGSDGYEVDLLQKILNVSTVGNFGPVTESALLAATGVKEITLKDYNNVYAAFQAKINAVKTKAQYEAAYPIGKQVVAAIKFWGPMAIWRNGNWFTTDVNGRPLPGKEFAATSQVGTVYSSDVNEPSLLIIILPKALEAGGYALPAGQDYRKIRVKASWVK